MDGLSPSGVTAAFPDRTKLLRLRRCQKFVKQHTADTTVLLTRVLSVLTANPPGRLKVRSLWSVIDGMLSSTKEEQRAVDSVLKGDADQHVLDGTDQVLRIPRTLQERVEQLPHQVRGGPESSDSPDVSVTVLETGDFFQSHHFDACFPVEFGERVRSRPAEPAVCVGADEPRPAAPEGRAPLAFRRSPTTCQPCTPAGETPANGSRAAEPAPDQVHTEPGGTDAFHLLFVLKISDLFTDRRFLRKDFLRSVVPSESWRPSGTGSGWIP